MMDKIRTVILGASGYTGAELLRLLAHHPHVNIVALTGESQAGKPMAEVYPHLATAQLPDLVKIAEVDFTQAELVFCCLPHATTQAVLKDLPEQVKIVDLSADFRLHDPAKYAQWYGHEHQALALQAEAVYGLCEVYRDAIAAARLVANPGCYPTSNLLPMIPLLKAGLVQADSIFIDAMSGVSGAGRSVAQRLLYCEVNEGAGAYGVGGHRHAAEMEQEIALAAGHEAIISFTPHLVPMDRGISSTIHVKLQEGASIAQVEEALQQAYAHSPFVHVMADTPTTHHVRGTNECRMRVVKDRVDGHIIIVSVIDNLIKGAAGQAIQNMNIMFGLDEVTGLQQRAIQP